MEDGKIIELFFRRSEQAIHELDVKYGALCHHLSLNIVGDRQDAEECVSDAYLGMWNTVPPARPDLLPAYLCKLVRNISLKLCRRKHASKRNSAYDVALSELETCLPAAQTVESEIETKELSHIIESFLNTLTVENRVIFMRRYWFSDTYTEIAGRTGLTEKNVSVRLTRIRRQLKQYLQERGVSV